MTNRESVSHLPLLLHLECVWGQLQSTDAPNQLVVHQRPAANCDGWVVTDSSQPEGSEEGGRTQAGQSSKQRGRQQQKEGVEAMVVTLLLRMIAHTLLSLVFRRRLFIDLPRVHVDQLHLPLLTLQAETWRVSSQAAHAIWIKNKNDHFLTYKVTNNLKVMLDASFSGYFFFKVLSFGDTFLFSFNKNCKKKST